MLLSFTSFLYGYVAPAPVKITPACAASCTVLFAVPSGRLQLIKYPPLGSSQVAISDNSSLSILSTASNFG